MGGEGEKEKWRGRVRGCKIGRSEGWRKGERWIDIEMETEADSDGWRESAWQRDKEKDSFSL